MWFRTWAYNTVNHAKFVPNFGYFCRREPRGCDRAASGRRDARLMVSHPTLPDSSDPARKLRFKCPSPVRACQLRCATTRDRIATHASCAQRRRSVRARFFMPPICEAVAALQAGGRAPRWPTYSVGSARSAPRMAPTPSSSTSLAVQAMAMRAAQRLTGLLSVSLFLQTAFVCDPRRRVVLIFVCVGVVTACCSVMGLGDDRSSASICSCTSRFF